MKKKRVMVYQPKAANGMETQGGGQDQMQQMVQQIQQMLQQADPQQVIAALLQQVQDPAIVVQLMSAATQTPPDQMAQAVQQVAQQMGQEQANASVGQGEPSAEEQAQAQEEQPQMNHGGTFTQGTERLGWLQTAADGTELPDDRRYKKDSLGRYINQEGRVVKEDDDTWDYNGSQYKLSLLTGEWTKFDKNGKATIVTNPNEINNVLNKGRKIWNSTMVGDYARYGDYDKNPMPANLPVKKLAPIDAWDFGIRPNLPTIPAAQIPIDTPARERQLTLRDPEVNESINKINSLSERLNTYSFGGEIELQNHLITEEDVSAFDQIRKDMLKKAKKGGETELDMSSTDTYVDSLRKSILDHMHTGYAVNTIKNSSFGDIAAKMGIPMAKNGIDLPKADDGFDKQKYAKYADYDYKMLEEAAKLGQISNEELQSIMTGFNIQNPNSGGNTGGGNFRSSTPGVRNPNTGQPMSWEELDAIGGWKGFTDKFGDPRYYSVDNPSGKAQEYFPGYGPGMPQYGWMGYGQQQRSLNPWAQLFGSVGPNYKGTTGVGFGEFEGKSLDDFMKAIATTHEVTNIDPIYKQNIFGKEKRHKEKNIIGGRFTTQLRGSADPDADNDANVDTDNDNDGANTNVTNSSSSYGKESPYISAIRKLMDADISEKQAKKWGLWPDENTASGNTAGPLVGTEGYDALGKEYGRRMEETEGKWNDAIQLTLEKYPDLLNKPESEWTDEEWEAVDANYKYKCGGTVHRPRMPKAEDGYDLSVDKGWGVNNWNQFAMGVEGVGNKVSDFLGRLNSIQNPNDILANRSIDAIAPVAPPHSGLEGQWWENLMKQMAQDAGANVRSSSGTDWAGFAKNQRGISGDLISQQQGFEGGGIVERKEVILNDDQLKRLEAAGYKLKQLY